MTQELPNAFQPAPPPGAVSPSTAPRPRRKKAAAQRQPRVPKNLHAVTDEEIKANAAKKARKKRAAKAEKAAPETVKVSLKEYATMRCGDSAKLFLKAHKLLSGASAGARRTVLTELTSLLS